jgi:predicted cupin superfamily sugar epimerase
MVAHPEGGFYVECYRSDNFNLLSDGRQRPYCTHIYYLLPSGDFSSWHKIKSDEIWHHYSGDPLVVVSLAEKEGVVKQKIGSTLDYQPSCVVDAGKWFAAGLAEDVVGCCLVGCTVAPGFDFDDFTLGSREEVLKEFPNYKGIINKYAKL